MAHPNFWDVDSKKRKRTTCDPTGDSDDGKDNTRREKAHRTTAGLDHEVRGAEARGLARASQLGQPVRHPHDHSLMCPTNEGDANSNAMDDIVLSTQSATDINTEPPLSSHPRSSQNIPAGTQGFGDVAISEVPDHIDSGAKCVLEPAAYEQQRSEDDVSMPDSPHVKKPQQSSPIHTISNTHDNSVTTWDDSAEIDGIIGGVTPMNCDETVFVAYAPDGIYTTIWRNHEISEITWDYTMEMDASNEYEGSILEPMDNIYAESEEPNAYESDSD
ncbi:hypothetical protein B0A50_07596 [Salinomyces thailandicus]|uniref:Uncharacterized protein n=1 Tax=Salinomyces thailandicus TaxID=706561 RepID=A0A4U0TMK3_9PEZI|nr:hypothetical protein B0A50_08839 [Salinomyces thailandica]TKA23203.1 hypothetical protein B0A50_07596 [Salinomyces thailandica]